jgi:uncharacterized protein YdhG (YjbR/CyaY superfamily)
MTDASTHLVDAYLARLSANQRRALASLRAQLLRLVPNAEEAIRTRVPAIRYLGKTVVGFGAAQTHVALYVMFGEALTALGPELAGYDASRRVVRFAPEHPLPAALVQRIVRFRLAEIDAGRPSRAAPRRSGTR